jgi:hypothetical protein
MCSGFWDKFKTRKALAEFWDTHDITDYLDDLKPKMEQGITVRFPVEDLQRLRVIANRKRVGVTTLIRMLSLEFLNNPNHRVLD